MRLLPSLLLFMGGVAANSQAQDTGYSFVFIPTSIQEVDLAFPLKGNFSTQIDLQTITQGAQLGQNNNPFAYWRRIHFQPWLQYTRIDNLQLAFSTSYIKRFAVPPVGFKASTEIRITAMGTTTQPKTWGSLYEQGRLELRNTKSEGTTDWQTVPRVRFRFGQSFNAGNSHWKHRIPLYEEVLFKYQKHTKGLNGVRFFGGYGFNPTQEWAVTLGLILRYQLQSSGTEFNVLFGPSFEVKYQAGKPGATP